MGVHRVQMVGLAPHLSRLALFDLPGGLRVRDTATERFWFNYDAETVTYEGRSFEPASVTRELRT